MNNLKYNQWRSNYESRTVSLLDYDLVPAAWEFYATAVRQSYNQAESTWSTRFLLSYTVTCHQLVTLIVVTALSWPHDRSMICQHFEDKGDNSTQPRTRNAQCDAWMIGVSHLYVIQRMQPIAISNVMMCQSRVIQSGVLVSATECSVICRPIRSRWSSSSPRIVWMCNWSKRTMIWSWLHLKICMKDDLTRNNKWCIVHFN